MMQKHLTQAELGSLLKEAKEQITIGSQYVHYKDTTKTYIVRDVAILEATNQPVVVYQAEYGARITFVRPVKEWLEEVENNDQKVPRFKSLPAGMLKLS